MGYDRMEQIREGVLGDGLEGNFWEDRLPPVASNQVDSTHINVSKHTHTLSICVYSLISCIANHRRFARFRIKYLLSTCFILIRGFLYTRSFALRNKSRAYHHYQCFLQYKISQYYLRINLTFFNVVNARTLKEQSLLMKQDYLPG